MKYPHVRQHDENDCGAACLSMVCEYYGLKLPITRFRELIKVDNFGASMYGIITGAKKLGLSGDPLEGNPDELLDGTEKGEIPFPFIARIVNEENYEHYIVVYAIKNGKAYVGDPGKIQITKTPLEKFFSQWQGQIIAFTKDENFRKGNERRGTLRKFFKLITRQKKLLAAVFISSLIIAGISIFSATIFEYVIDDAVEVGDVNGEYEHEHELVAEEEGDESRIEIFFEKMQEKIDIVFHNLETVCISIIILYIIQAALRSWRGYILARMAKNVELPINLGYFDHLVDLPAGFFGTRKTGELLSRFSDASNIREAISTATLTIMMDTLMAVIVGIYLFFMNHTLFLITIIVMVAYALVMFCFRKPIKRINQDIMEGNAQVTSYLKEVVDGIETVKAYDYEDASKAKTKNLFTKFVNRVVHGSVVYNYQNVLVTLIESVGLVFILWVGAHLCVENIFTVGILITFYYLLDYFLEPVKELIELQPTLQTATVAAERLNDILDVDVEDNTKDDAKDLKGDIKFENVDFRYGNRSLVLKNVSMIIPKGKKIALVGESGCGKTTLAKLLMNFYVPEKGTVTVNGKNISSYSPKSVRKHIAYISQDIFLFSDNVYSNMRMGDDSITNEEIENVCKMCLADEFIKEMPFGYETMLEENGNNLSGGQKQRLAIARALLRKPDILIMDEATSNLDVITEESIRKIIDGVSKDMTVIIIAHRLRTIRSCDYIYVMANGEVKEEGTHEELLDRGGIYSDYWNSQPFAHNKRVRS